MFLLVLTIILAGILFFLSRQTSNELFRFFRIFIKDEKTIFVIITLIFLPGTIVHELAHFFAATILFMKVRDLKIFPEFYDNEIKLGHVLYEKKDFIRGILVGIAPIFAGLLFFWFMAYFKLFPHKNIFLSIFFLYLIFAVSSTMFSSKQDLVDIIYILPVLVILAGIIFIFNLRIDVMIQNKTLSEGITQIMSKINLYLFLSLGVNIVIIMSLKAFRKFHKLR